MGLAEDLSAEVDDIFSTKWETRNGQKVPEPEDVRLGNEAVSIDGTVLYADLAESTKLVDGYKWWFAAEVYKAYLLCASRLIRAAGGTITAFDGDRVMGIFYGGYKNTSAAKCALHINWAVERVLNSGLSKHYPKDTYRVAHAVGVDTSSLFAARTGIRGSNDLVWVGRAANYAAKLCAVRFSGYPSLITADVYNPMNAEAKYEQGQPVWQSATWPDKNVTIYASSWWFAPGR